jgi:hypothetical protein
VAAEPLKNLLIKQEGLQPIIALLFGLSDAGYAIEFCSSPTISLIVRRRPIW